MHICPLPHQPPTSLPPLIGFLACFDIYLTVLGLSFVMRDLSFRAQAPCLWYMGLVAPWHVASLPLTRDRTWVPSIGRWILNHQTTRKSQVLLFYWNTVLCTRNPAAWAKRVSSRAAPPTGRPHGSGHGGMPATCRSLLSRAFPISKKAKAGESHLMISNIFQGPGCSVKPQ